VPESLPEVDHFKWFLILMLGSVAGLVFAYMYRQTIGQYIDAKAGMLTSAVATVGGMGAAAGGVGL
jgi:hypothetical protein